MKQFLFTSCLLIGCLGLSSSTVHAQSWQWGIRGGSTDGLSGGADETVTDMATDPNGNVYVLSNVTQTALNVDGIPLSGWGSQDILLSSFKCDGTFRWSKIIGGNGDDLPSAVKTDTLGGVYLIGALATHYINIHFDADTTWSTGASYKTLVIAKYDSSGTYQWLKMPQPDTAGINSISNVRALDVDVDGGGNIAWLCKLTPGLYGNSYVAPASGIYVLQYNKDGLFGGGTKLQATCSALAVGGLILKKDWELGRYYMTGDAAYQTDLSFNGVPVTRSLYIAVFDNEGNLLWQKQNTNINTSGSFGRAAIDAAHNVYLVGTAANTDTFNNYEVTNQLSPYSFGDDVPLVMKIDTDGNNLWAKSGLSDAQTYFSEIALNGTEVVIAGAYPGILKWPGYPDSLHHVLNQKFDIAITRFDASSGNILGMDSLASSFGTNEFSTAIAKDAHGNVYVGGNFNGDLEVNTDTLNTVGGGSDFFVAKFGYDNCTCTGTPVSNYSYTGTSVISFTYTGTTTGIDSVVWSFGDGNSATGTSATHTYFAAGTYNACATVYAACGSNVHCGTIVVAGPASVAGIAFTSLNVFPNPATDVLHIDHAPQGSLVKLTNVMGQQVYSSTIISGQMAVSMSSFTPGTYLLQLIDANGNSKAMIITKE